MQPRNLLIGLVLGIAIAAGIMLALRNSAEQALPRAATILPAGNTLPDFELLDHEGAPAGKSVFEGQWDVVFFGFTHCPDICPATMTVLGQAKRQLETEGRQPLPRVVLVSVGNFFEKAGGETAAYGVDHSTVVLVIYPRGRLRALFSTPHTVADLVHDLPLIMASES